MNIKNKLNGLEAKAEEKLMWLLDKSQEDIEYRGLKTSKFKLNVKYNKRTKYPY